MIDSSYIKENGDWLCRTCHYRNFRRQTSCRQCARGSRNTLPNTSQNNSIKVRGDDWFCPNCKAHQFARNTECRDCKTPKPNEDAVDQQKCIICCTNQRNSSLTHGNTAHIVTCYDCGVKLKNCPVCRQNVTKVIKVYD